MTFFDTFMDPVLNPLLALGPFWAVFVLSLLISLIIVLVYKYATNQEEMKSLKLQQKEFQKKTKALKGQPEEMIKVQKEAMQTNMKYMKHSFKATLITMLPMLVIFGWMNTHLAFEPIYPGETYSISALLHQDLAGEKVELIVPERTEFSTNPNTGKRSEAEQEIKSLNQWYLESPAGEHLITVKVNDVEQLKKVLVTADFRYEEPLKSFKDSPIQRIQIDYKKLKPLQQVKEGGVSIFGWEPGWLGVYIFFSIIFSIGLRKLLKVH